MKNQTSKSFPTTVVLEWAGCTFGLLGAFLLALNNSASGYGFVAFLLSNFCWMLFARKIKASGLLLMQLGFTATSVVGIFNWLFENP